MFGHLLEFIEQSLLCTGRIWYGYGLPWRSDLNYRYHPSFLEIFHRYKCCYSSFQFQNQRLKRGAIPGWFCLKIRYITCRLKAEHRGTSQPLCAHEPLESIVEPFSQCPIPKCKRKISKAIQERQQLLPVDIVIHLDMQGHCIVAVTKSILLKTHVFSPL